MKGQVSRNERSEAVKTYSRLWKGKGIYNDWQSRKGVNEEQSKNVKEETNGRMKERTN